MWHGPCTHTRKIGQIYAKCRPTSEINHLARVGVSRKICVWRRKVCVYLTTRNHWADRRNVKTATNHARLARKSANRRQTGGQTGKCAMLPNTYEQVQDMRQNTLKRKICTGGKLNEINHLQPPTVPERVPT